MKKIIFALAMSLFLMPAFAQRNNDRNNHRDNDRHERRDDRHHDIHNDDHHRPPAPVRIATAEEVDMIYNYIRGISFDKDKLSGIKICMQLSPMRAEDIARVVRLISFDDTKMDALKFCYDLCPDKEHYSVAINVLTFDMHKDKMYKYIANH